MQYKIGAIWTNKIKNLTKLVSEDIIICDNVKISESEQVGLKLKSKGVRIVVTTSGPAAKLEQCQFPIPMIVGYPSDMDLLETLIGIEKNFKITDKKIALIIHETNPYIKDRLISFIKNEIVIIRYRDEQHIEEIIDDIYYKKEYYGVIGGPTTMAIANKIKLNKFPLQYGEDILFDALSKAEKMMSLIKTEDLLVQKLETVVKISSNGIIITDNNGYIDMCNTKAMSFLGFADENIIGRKICEVTKDPTWEHIYKEGENDKDHLVQYNMKEFFLRRNPIIKDEEIIGSVGTFQEPTEIERLERKYRSAQNSGFIAKYTFNDVIGNSEIMRSIVKRSKMYAKYDSTVIIHGETGTGKEIFAQSIHNESFRRNGPFVAINCAALTESLLESELMGYEEGAFTGAKKDGKMGLFERAHKGTLLLDEISQMPMQLQTKLLRVIQEKSIIRLGGERVIPIDVRIMAATNENLNEKMRQGKFRNDLYYRLNVLNIKLPPLRERREDIPSLIGCFISKFSNEYKKVKCTPEEVLKFVLNYDWPGNIRELENYVKRFAILSLENKHNFLDAYFFDDFDTNTVNVKHNENNLNNITINVGTLLDMEKQIISKIVKSFDNNKSKAALLLDINRNTINNKLKK